MLERRQWRYVESSGRPKEEAIEERLELKARKVERLE
jgi:hypothetical protein